MVIGIDDSGTFDITSDKMALFAGVHFPTAADVEVAAARLAAWKARYKHLKNHQGEIKGSLLDDAAAEDFVDSVVVPIPIFGVTICATIPSEHKKRDIQFHRDHLVKSVDKGIAKCRAVGNTALAAQYVELRNWYKNLNYELLLKSFILGEMITVSYREHIIDAILRGHDQTLGEFRIAIDQDFVKSREHIIFWKDLLRSKFWSYTYRNPVPVIAEWPDGHPYYMTHGRGSDTSGTHVDTNNVFRRSCNFYKSHETPEIQIADIVGKIVTRYHNDKAFVSAYGKLRPYLLPERSPKIKLLKMTTPEEAKPDPAPNPYEVYREEIGKSPETRNSDE